MALCANFFLLFQDVGLGIHASSLVLLEKNDFARFPLTTLEELAQARFTAARGTKLEVLRVKARRLEIELQSEQAKTASAK